MVPVGGDTFFWHQRSPQEDTIDWNLSILITISRFLAVILPQDYNNRKFYLRGSYENSAWSSLKLVPQLQSISLRKDRNPLVPPRTITLVQGSMPDAIFLMWKAQLLPPPFTCLGRQDSQNTSCRWLHLSGKSNTAHSWEMKWEGGKAVSLSAQPRVRKLRKSIHSKWFNNIEVSNWQTNQEASGLTAPSSLLACTSFCARFNISTVFPLLTGIVLVLSWWFWASPNTIPSAQSPSAHPNGTCTTEGPYSSQTHTLNKHYSHSIVSAMCMNDGNPLIPLVSVEMKRDHSEKVIIVPAPWKCS